MEDGSHVTWDFNPGKCELPEGIKEGDEVVVVYHGKYHDDDVDADVVSVFVNGSCRHPLQYQPNSGYRLHITREVRNGFSPVIAGQRIKENGFTFDALCENVGFEPITAKAGFFRA